MTWWAAAGHEEVSNQVGTWQQQVKQEVGSGREPETSGLGPFCMQNSMQPADTVHSAQSTQAPWDPLAGKILATGLA